MTILPSNWKIKDRSIYISKYDALIIGDVHLNQSVTEEYSNIISRIKLLINKFQPSILIFNGDTFNQGLFDSKEINILKDLKSLVENIVLLEGNHEKKSKYFNKEILSKFTLNTEYMIGDILIHHGHRTPSQKANHHIVSHLHPKKDNKPVYLHCNDCYYGSSVTVLPAFNKNVLGVEYNDFNVNIPIITDGKSIKNYDFIFN